MFKRLTIGVCTLTLLFVAVGDVAAQTSGSAVTSRRQTRTFNPYAYRPTVRTFGWLNMFRAPKAITVAEETVTKEPAAAVANTATEVTGPSGAEASAPMAASGRPTYRPPVRSPYRPPPRPPFGP